MTFRAILLNPNVDLDVVAINDLTSTDMLAYLLKYDSTHGRFDGTVTVKNGQLIINGQAVRISAERDPANLKWDEVGADLVLECTGLFLSQEAANAHILAGAKRVVLSAPAKDDTPTYVMGVNHHLLNKDQHIISNASCTTNCLAPITKVLNDNFGIEEGLMTSE